MGVLQNEEHPFLKRNEDKFDRIKDDYGDLLSLNELLI